MKVFFGWSNLKWLVKEIMNLYSDKTSYFSKKRVESGVSFFIAQAGMITYFIYHNHKMDMYTLLMWAGAEFLIAGYSINQIQKEKQIPKQ